MQHLRSDSLQAKELNNNKMGDKPIDPTTGKKRGLVQNRQGIKQAVVED